MVYTSITYKQTLVNFRTTFVDDNANDIYDISYNADVGCDISMNAIDITEAELKAGFETGNCATESPSAAIYTGEKYMIAQIRAKLNQALDSTVTVEADKSVKQKLLEFINNQDVSPIINRIKWLELSYAPVVLLPFATGLVGTDLALTTYDIAVNDIINFIFRFSGGPRSVDSASPSFYTVKIPFKIISVTAPPVSGDALADTALPA